MTDLIDEELPANMCRCGKIVEPPDELVRGMCNECWQYDQDTLAAYNYSQEVKMQAEDRYAAKHN